MNNVPQYIRLEPRTESERKAYIEGFERCADCIEEYLNNEGKMMLKGLLMVLRSMKGAAADEEEA